jgi:hypothetical protein
MKRILYIIYFLTPVILFGQGITNNGGFITVQNGSYLTISGGVNGKYTNQSNANNHGRINLAGTIELQGDWINKAASGNFVFSGIISSNGTVLFKSANAQIIGGTELTNYQNIIINNPNGVTLNKNENINGKLILTSGNLFTLSNILSLTPASHVVGGSSSSYVVGYIRKFYSHLSDNPFTFPLGTLSGTGVFNSGYSPVVILFDTIPTSGSLTATVNPDKDSHADQSLSLNRFWTLNSALTFSGRYNAMFSYLGGDFISPFTESLYESTMVFGQWTNSWNYPSISLRDSTGSGGSIQLSGLNTFGEFTGLLCPKPVINSQPSDITMCEGTSVNFYVNATGTNLSYQWSKGGSDIAGATNSSFILNNVKTIDFDVYSCKVRNICGSVNINPFTLTVNSPPTGYTVFVTETKFVGDSANYSISPGGTAPFTYQWKHNGVVIPDLISNVLKIKSLAIADSGLYTCKIINICDSVTVKIVHLVIIPVSRYRYNISGKINYDNTLLSAMNTTTIYVYNSEDVKIDSANTDISGAYIFHDLFNGSYKLKCKIARNWGGSNPLDALLVNRYFIGSFIITDPLKLKAADVSNNKVINPLDALMINRRYIGALHNFPAPDWIFESPTVIVIGADVTQNIKAICTGDVNASYSF